jgi:hypothetical protein
MIKTGDFCRTSQSLFVGVLPVYSIGRISHKPMFFTGTANNEVQASRDFILWYCIALLCQGSLWPPFRKHLTRILVQDKKLQSTFTNFYAWRNIPVNPEVCPVGSLISKRTNVPFHGNSAALVAYYYYTSSGFHGGYWSGNSALEFDTVHNCVMTPTFQIKPSLSAHSPTWCQNLKYNACILLRSTDGSTKTH